MSPPQYNTPKYRSQERPWECRNGRGICWPNVSECRSYQYLAELDKAKEVSLLTWSYCTLCSWPFMHFRSAASPPTTSNALAYIYRNVDHLDGAPTYGASFRNSFSVRYSCITRFLSLANIRRFISSCYNMSLDAFRFYHNPFSPQSLHSLISQLRSRLGSIQDMIEVGRTLSLIVWPRIPRIELLEVAGNLSLHIDKVLIHIFLWCARQTRKCILGDGFPAAFDPSLGSCVLIVEIRERQCKHGPGFNTAQ